MRCHQVKIDQASFLTKTHTSLWLMFLRLLTVVWLNPWVRTAEKSSVPAWVPRAIEISSMRCIHLLRLDSATRKFSRKKNLMNTNNFKIFSFQKSRKDYNDVSFCFCPLNVNKKVQLELLFECGLSYSQDLMLPDTFWACNSLFYQHFHLPNSLRNYPSRTFLNPLEH